MASIRRRSRRWQVQIRRKDQPATSKSFLFLKDAGKWAREQEQLADTGRLTTRSISASSVSDLLEEYLTRVTPKKRGAKQEAYLIRRVQMGPLGSLPISRISAQPFADYRDQRLKTVSPGTIRREFSLLRHAFSVARNEWDWAIPDNPIARIHLPHLSQPRERRLEPEEAPRLLRACSKARTPWLKPAVGTGP